MFTDAAVNHMEYLPTIDHLDGFLTIESIDAKSSSKAENIVKNQLFSKKSAESFKKIYIAYKHNKSAVFHKTAVF